MRRLVLFAASIAACEKTSAEPEVYAIVLGVRSVGDIEGIDVTVLARDENPPRSWQQSFEVPHGDFLLSSTPANPITIRIPLDAPGSYAVHLAGTPIAAQTVFTGCYDVDGVEEDPDVMMGALPVDLDADQDTWPDDRAVFCDEIVFAGWPGGCGDHTCEDALAGDCSAADASIHPMADDPCGGLDQDCDGHDPSCDEIDCSLPENQDVPECNCGGAECAAGEKCCADVCIPTDSDLANCGDCDVACDPTVSNACSGGQCRCGIGSPCGAASHCEGGACLCDPGLGDCTGGTTDGCETDVLGDEANCGTCGTVCPPGVDCAGGSCGCTDDAECGVNGDCVTGVCGCRSGFGDCVGGVADGCETDTETDEANCGGCGTTCGAGEICSFGSCGCGAAGPCGPRSSCIGVICACDAGWGDCAGGRADGCETDVTSDDANCGGCGDACDAGETCIASACDCGGAGVCPTNFVCEAAACHCDQDADCDGPGGGTFTCRANGLCRCGGVNCLAGEWCDAGACAAAP
jgi:hypothetical protein